MPSCILMSVCMSMSACRVVDLLVGVPPPMVCTLLYWVHDHPTGAAGAVSDAAAAPLINQNRTRTQTEKHCLWFRTGFASNLTVSSSSRNGDPEHPAHGTRCKLLLLLLLLLICALVYWVCSTTRGTTPVYYKHPGVARNMCSTQRVLHCD